MKNRFVDIGGVKYHLVAVEYAIISPEGKEVRISEPLVIELALRNSFTEEEIKPTPLVEPKTAPEPSIRVERTPFTMPNFVLWRNGYNHQIVGYVDTRGKLLGWNTRELKEYVISNESYKRMSERGEFAFISLDIFNQAISGHARKFDMKLNRVVVAPDATPTLPKSKPRGHGRKPKSIEELKSEYKGVIRATEAPKSLIDISPSILIGNPSVIRPVMTNDDPKISQGWLVGAFDLKFDEAVRLISYCFKRKILLKTDITDEFVKDWCTKGKPMS